MTRTLLITGASSGIGAATARAAAAQGWRLGLFARSREKLEALAAELGPDALPLPGDVASLEDQERAVAECVARFGGLDAAFANAGVGASAPGTEGGDPADWRRILDANIWGLMMTAKAALPELRKRRGHFVVTGSAAGARHIPGSIYGASKWFARGFAGNLALEMAEWGGRCTLLAPGMADTPFFDAPKPEALRPEDVARAALYALEQPPQVDVREITVLPNPKARD